MRRLSIALAIALSVAVVSPTASASSDPIELSWDMLVPQRDDIASLSDRLASLGLREDGSSSGRLGGIVAHGGGWFGAGPDLGSELVTEYNGKSVRLPGYVVPLDYDDEGTKNLLLVPFIGACIHVPPPPPNQIVVVLLEEKRQFEYFEPIFVTGVIDAIPSSLDLAEVGYRIEATGVEPYPYDDAWEDNPGVDIGLDDEGYDYGDEPEGGAPAQ